MKIKEINDNNYLEAKIIMLQLDKPSYLQIIQRDILTRKKGTLEIHDSPWSDVDNDFKPQHLYVFSEEKINVEDFIYDTVNKKVWKCGSIINDMAICDKLQNKCHRNVANKIIATTDESLNESIKMVGRKAKEAFDKILPNIPKEFIEKYVESYNSGNPIKDVLVEYDKGFNGFSFDGKETKEINRLGKIKVYENDEINITTRAFEFIKKYPKESLGSKNEDWSKLAKIGSPDKWMEVYLHYQELLLENDTREFLDNIPKPNWDDVFVKISKYLWFDTNGDAQINYNSLRSLLEEKFNPPTLKNNN